MVQRKNLRNSEVTHKFSTVSLNRKKTLSFTPLNCERKFFILALKDSDVAFVERLSK